MNSQRTLKLQKLATLVIIWSTLAIFLTLFDHFILVSHHSTSPSEHYSFWGNFTFNILSGFFGGLIGGAYLIFVIDEKFRTEPYFKGIIAVFLGFVVIVIFFTLFSSTIEAVLKAGIHFGNVIAGEIGIIKRDVTYSGDVLNTTARIQSQCNSHEVDFLCSKEMSDLIKPGDSLQLQAIGAIPLRGKEEKVELVSVKRV